MIRFRSYTIMLIPSFPLLLIFLSNFIQANSDEVQNVFLLWRHGDRAPSGNYLNKDKSFDKLWPLGPEQLTYLGIKQQFDLGDFLRNKYQNFIPKNYSFRDYHVRSTACDRTIMSAQANLAGFFSQSYSPLTLNQSDKFKWRPVPVHTVSKSQEALFAYQPCKRAQELMQEDFNSKDGKAIISEYQSEINTLEKELSKKISIWDIWGIRDEIVCLEAHNYSIPEWLTLKIRDALTKISLHFWHVRSQEKERLSFQVGVFLHNMFTHMKDLISNGKASVNVDGEPVQLAKNHIMAFSAHDINLGPLLVAFGMEQPEKPAYAACIMIELIGPVVPGQLKDFKIRVLYKNSSDTSGDILKFSSFCKDETQCPFETVWAEMSKYFLTESEYTEQCNVESSSSHLSVILGVIIPIIFIILVLFTIYIYYRRSQNKGLFA